jgi:hypothetical protein
LSNSKLCSTDLPYSFERSSYLITFNVTPLLAFVTLLLTY